MSYNGTPVGSPTYAAAASGFGQAIVLNGTTQYVTMPAAAIAFTAGTSWRVRVRIKTTASGLQVAASNADCAFVGTNGGKAFVNPTGFAGLTGTTNVNDGAWHLTDLWVIHTPVNGGTPALDTAYLYVDGALEATTTGTYAPTSTGALSAIGAMRGTTTYDFRFAGQIDVVEAYTIAPAPGNYTPPTTPTSRLAAGLQALYHLDGNVNDSAVIYTRTNPTLPGGSLGMVLRPPTPNGIAVYYHHGAGETQTALLDDALKADTVAMLLLDGCTLAACDAHSTVDAGNDQALTDYAELRAHVRGTYSVTATVLWPQSLGGQSALLSLEVIPVSECWTIMGTYPVTSFGAFYNGPLKFSAFGSFRPAIQTAYGFAGDDNFASATAGHDPTLADPNLWAGRRFALWASAGDTIVPRFAHSDAFATLVARGGGVCTVHTATGEHGDPSHFDPAAYLSFLHASIDAGPPAIPPTVYPTAADIVAAIRASATAEPLPADLVSVNGDQTAAAGLYSFGTSIAFSADQDHAAAGLASLGIAFNDGEPLPADVVRFRGSANVVDTIVRVTQGIKDAGDELGQPADTVGYGLGSLATTYAVSGTVPADVATSSVNAIRAGLATETTLATVGQNVEAARLAAIAGPGADTYVGSRVTTIFAQLPAGNAKIASQADAQGGGPSPGAGADPLTVQFTLDGNGPLADADAWVTRDAGGQQIVDLKQTNTDGIAIFMVDGYLAGTTTKRTYYAWAQRDGVTSVQGIPVTCETVTA